MKLKTLIILLVILAFSEVSSSSLCRWGGNTTDLPGDVTHLGKVWSAQFSDVYRSNILPESDTLKQFRSRVQEQVDVNPFSLLTRQMDVFKRNGQFSSEIKKHDLIINKKVGHIQDMNCLEGLLLSEHLSRGFGTRAEFLALILQKGTDLKIYFLSQNGDGVAPDWDSIKNFVLDDLRKGWIYLANLHNHPFFFDNPAGDIAGTTIPSGDDTGGDIHFFKDHMKLYGMKEAWITNGFSSIHVNRSDVQTLSLLK